MIRGSVSSNLVNLSLFVCFCFSQNSSELNIEDNPSTYLHVLQLREVRTVVHTSGVEREKKLLVFINITRVTKCSINTGRRFIHTRTYTHIIHRYINTYICIHIYIYVCVCVCVYISVYMYTCIYM